MRANTKSIIPVVALFFCLLFIPSQTVDARDPLIVNIKNGEAMVTYLEGKITVWPTSETEPRLLQVNDSLKKGDLVNTGDQGLLEIVLPDGSFLRFSNNASFKINEIDCSKESEKRIVNVNVTFGKAWANIQKLFGGVKPEIALHSTNAVCGIRGTIFRMNVNDDQSVLVRTYEGVVSVAKGAGYMQKPLIIPDGPPKKIAGPTSVQGPVKVTMEEWTYIIKSMQQIQVSSKGVAEKPKAFTKEEDKSEWVDWNRLRDEFVKRIKVSIIEQAKEKEEKQ